jgi:PAS domain S-box-containing protein
MIKEVNRRFADTLGYTPAEIAVIPFTQIWTDTAARDRFFEILTTQGNVENFETRFVTKSGASLWVLLSAGMLPDDQFVCTIIDITKRKQAEEALIIKDHAISSSINAIAIMDLDFAITYVNTSLLTMMDYHDQQEFSHKGLWEYVASSDGIDKIKDALHRKGSWFGEIPLFKANKTQFYVLLWINLVKNEQNNPVCIMASFIDITDRKQMEAVKRSALEQIEKNIEQFAVLGDHIRNPLAVIVGLSSLAPGEVTDKIILQAREIDRIVTQLDMGWIESEKVREFIKRYYMVGALDSSENGVAGSMAR